MRFFLPLLCVAMLASTTTLDAQRVHMPDEIKRMMEQSEVQYQVAPTNADIPKKTYPNTGQQAAKLYRIEDALEIRLEEQNELNYGVKVEKSLAKGNKQLARKRYEKARKHYLQANTLKPSDTRITNRIGRTYFEEKDYPSAAYWYAQSINFNYIDTEAWRQSAECYKELGDTTKAIDHILMAHLFNRNDPVILRQMREIFWHFGMRFAHYNFEPSYAISQGEDGTVLVAYGHSVWASYASVMAMWQYEPNYELQMSRISNQPVHVIREKEALLNVIVTYDRLEQADKEKQFPLLAMISRASLQRQIDPFIIYEITSRKDPKSMLLLTPKELERIKRYILEYRNATSR